MKKFLKGRILLAIMAIAIISSVLMAGTYAWFIRTSENSIDETEAVIEAACFDIPAVGISEVIELDLFADIGFSGASAANTIKSNSALIDKVLGAGTADIVATTLDGYRRPFIYGIDPKLPGFLGLLNGVLKVDDVDKFENMYNEVKDYEDDHNPSSKVGENKYILYPGDGVRIEFDLAGVLNLNNNRDVLVELDLGVDFAEIDTAINNLKALSNDVSWKSIPNLGAVADVLDKYLPITVTQNDIWCVNELADMINAMGDNGKEVNGKYYILVPAGGLTLDSGVTEGAIEIGIIGIDRLQNQYMKGLNLTINPTIKATAIQATPKAVIAIFGIEVAEEFF
jgi:hypothetical protein